MTPHPWDEYGSPPRPDAWLKEVRHAIVVADDAHKHGRPTGVSLALLALRRLAGMEQWPGAPGGAYPPADMTQVYDERRSE